jgi:hypothetical protein
MDSLIICTHCGSDACYVDEVNKDIKTYFCYGCGFQTNSLMKEGEEFYAQQVEFLPEIYKDLLYNDGEKIWMPSVINIADKGMVFANGSGADNWSWSAVKAIPLTEGDKKVNENQTHKMDMTTQVEFARNDYMEALTYIGVLPE